MCVVSLESPHSLRTIVAVGASLPMEKGSGGRVLSGDRDALAQGWCESVEEREVGVASVSAPVYLDDEVVAAVSVFRARSSALHARRATATRTSSSPRPERSRRRSVRRSGGLRTRRS